MMKFTKEEISLCKQVAERHRKEIGKGDWFIYEDSDRTTGWSDPTLNNREYEPQRGYGKNVLLWTISDCLEFLKERGWWARIDFGTEDTNIFTFHENLPRISHLIEFNLPSYHHVKHWAEYPRHQGKVPLEALLKAVLAVLENS